MASHVSAVTLYGEAMKTSMPKARPQTINNAS